MTRGAVQISIWAVPRLVAKYESSIHSPYPSLLQIHVDIPIRRLMIHQQSPTTLSETWTLTGFFGGSPNRQHAPARDTLVRSHTEFAVLKTLTGNKRKAETSLANLHVPGDQHEWPTAASCNYRHICLSAGVHKVANGQSASPPISSFACLDTGKV